MASVQRSEISANHLLFSQLPVKPYGALCDVLLPSAFHVDSSFFRSSRLPRCPRNGFLLVGKALAAVRRARLAGAQTRHLPHCFAACVQTHFLYLSASPAFRVEPGGCHPRPLRFSKLLNASVEAGLGRQAGFPEHYLFPVAELETPSFFILCSFPGVRGWSVFVVFKDRLQLCYADCAVKA